MAQFKARARAVDMLGRQQISGRPTAISELFKNAHDAYADRVIVDFFRSDRLFVLRDDGLGMTQEDFERRWLTLGTESKLDAGIGLIPPPKDPDKAQRPIMGEKGIGRLAIGALGSQVLVLTRAKREGKLHDLVAAFIHWGLFTCPGIDLDQIEIPVRVFPGGTLPSEFELNQMIDTVRQNIEALNKVIDPKELHKFKSDLDQFTLDLKDIADYLDEPRLDGNGHGTHFYILPSTESLITDIDGNTEDSDTASPLVKMLIGFTNTMTPDHSTPNISASFRDHKSDETYEDLIEELEFFTPENFKIADHYIQGNFDEYGQFSGIISVYGEAIQHVVPWTNSKGSKTECGSFKINLAYVQGTRSESSILPEDYALINNKLKRIGGLYIYKEGIRILPYGSNDYDFLEIEKRRTLKASDYFFSYRRMFGVIEINQENNLGLLEKAGREGFIENKAYRQFRNILKSFFIKIAVDFFRVGGSYVDMYSNRRAELDRLEKARHANNKRSTAKRRNFSSSLENAFDQIEQAIPQQKISKILKSAESKFQAAAAIADREQAIDTFIKVEADARQMLNELKKSLKVLKPAGLGLSKNLRHQWDTYLDELERIETHVLNPAFQRIEEIARELSCNANINLDQQLRVRQALNDSVADAKKTTSSEAKKVREAADVLRNKIFKLAQDSILEVEKTTNDVIAQVSRINFSELPEKEVIDTRNSFEARISNILMQKRELLLNVRNQLELINWDPDEQGLRIGINDMTELLEEELLALREKTEEDMELSQLGMAIEVINHEFESSIKSIRNNLKRLKEWANVNEGLLGIYGNLRTSFDHLDGYLTLFTPLHRRLYRTPIEISGSDINQFLEDLFREKLARDKIQLEASPTFLSFKIIGYPSTFYPVFINLIDNALFWVQDSNEPRMIMLDIDGDSLLVSDTGSGVSLRDRGSIFEQGFTRKTGGRGLGLHISRDILKKVGYSLTLDETELGSGATFRIKPSES